MTITTIESIITTTENKVKQDTRTVVVSWWRSNWTKLVSEVVATFLLIFLGCAGCIPIDGFDPMPAVYAPLTFGFVVLINVQTFGHISGAHMNPCITLLSIFWGKVSIVLGISYFIAQVLGSTFASWVLSNVSPVDFVAEGVCVTQPHVRLVAWQAVIIEMVLTCTLCLVTSALWDPVNEKNQESSAIKFGLTVAGLSFAGGPLTGASMNPARTLGPALVAGKWAAQWVYWVGPFLGTFIAGLYMFIWLEKPKKSF
ncbi:aquaporin AQPAe.a-like [Leguminivora glycinivorella]|uniref:aquaporin AQPAe.a-like n=1 Tax=Leguminivora glycinivorella TaxID=1035111 RepID=UPI00200EEFE9|nr:aquaporin AQPAe.a-like [Leguminivora glycinivorella]